MDTTKTKFEHCEELAKIVAKEKQIQELMNIVFDTTPLVALDTSPLTRQSGKQRSTQEILGTMGKVTF